MTRPRRIAFFGGRILTMEPGCPRAEVLLVEGDRIARVGGPELLSLPGLERRDLRGRFLLPGFVDAHNHLSIAALHPLWADLSTARTPEDFARALREQARREPEAPWIRGFGWDEGHGGFVPDRGFLDSLDLGRPTLVAHYSLHQGVVDSRGLAELGIGRSTPDPPGGEIVRDARGEPTGLLVERAWSEAHARSLAAYRDPERWPELVLGRARTLLSEGVTCVHDAACSPRAEALYGSMLRDLPLSVLAMPHPEALFFPPELSRLGGAVTGEGTEVLRVGAWKLFADGGAAPAIDGCLGGERVRYGTLFPDLEVAVREVAERGFDVAIHAIGNAGLEAALDAIEAYRRKRKARPVRFRIEHVVLASPRQIRRMATLGVTPVVQPAFVDHIGRAVRDVRFEDLLWLPFASLRDAGLELAASSDHPCAFSAPLLGAARGSTRRTAGGEVLLAEEAVPFEEWLRAFTLGAARAGGQENERGSLREGKRADLVVLEGELDPERPPAVVETWVGGTCAFSVEQDG
ncbi:MAG: amidohydrolase [Candidatus Binatia bacterium]|nr:MAG: amidohydrolase [Candidatus Binatia bacterium]